MGVHFDVGRDNTQIYPFSYVTFIRTDCTKTTSRYTRPDGGGAQSFRTKQNINPDYTGARRGTRPHAIKILEFFFSHQPLARSISRQFTIFNNSHYTGLRAREQGRRKHVRAPHVPIY